MIIQNYSSLLRKTSHPHSPNSYPNQGEPRVTYTVTVILQEATPTATTAPTTTTSRETKSESSSPGILRFSAAEVHASWWGEPAVIPGDPFWAGEKSGPPGAGPCWCSSVQELQSQRLQ